MVQVRVLSPVTTRVAFRKVIGGCILAAMEIYDVDGLAKPQQLFQSDVLGPSHTLHPHFVSILKFSELLEPGQYTVVAKYGGCQDVGSSSISKTSDSPYPPFPPADYPATTNIDMKTRGDWKGKYGADGFILFGFDNGKDVSSLPSYIIGNVTKYYMWGGGPHDPPSHFRGRSQVNETYLQNPSEEPWRALGSVGDEVQAGRGLVIDIPIEPSSPAKFLHCISIYMVANDQNDEFVVKAMDYKTRSSIALVASVRDHSNGVYLTIKYPSGVRLRFAPLFGATTVSAVFFDRVALY